ncbi:TPA: lpg1124 family Dot/Icm T4SS effector [Legionella anisa]
MQAKFFDSTSIPKTSQEAFHLLTKSHDLEEIQNVLFHFKQLVNIKKSKLISHARQDSKIPNNQEFIENLETLFQRLKSAVEDEKPYQSLFGDVCKLKEDLQVILGYYNSQLCQNQPIVKSYLRQARSKHSEVGTVASGILSQEKSLLNEEDSSILTKYTINFSAEDIMIKDLQMISDFVLKPHLADHSKEAGFSYI